ncbi:hypothetical protein ACW5CM_02280 [Microbacterium sp. A588]
MNAEVDGEFFVGADIDENDFCGVCLSVLAVADGARERSALSEGIEGFAGYIRGETQARLDGFRNRRCNVGALGNRTADQSEKARRDGECM